MNGFLPFNSIMTPSSAFFSGGGWCRCAAASWDDRTTKRSVPRSLAERRSECFKRGKAWNCSSRVNGWSGCPGPDIHRDRSWIGPPFKVLYRVVKGGETSKISKEMFTRKYLGRKMIQFDYYIRCLFMGWFNHPARGGSVGFSLVLVVWCLFFLGGWDGSVVGDLEIGGRTARVLKRDVKSWVFTRAGLPKWAAWTSWRNRFLDAVLWMGRCK